MWAKQKQPGFTIVELLIVIVVIAILAAITIVAYNGIQQRANNTAIIDAASKSLRIIQAYIAEKGTYPTTVGACLTTESGCVNNSTVSNGNSALDANLATIGTIPKNIPNNGTTHNGISVTYASNTTWNGESQPLRLSYYLNGNNQQCGLARVSAYAYPGYTTSNTGFTNSNHESSGKTLCWISVPGPGV